MRVTRCPIDLALHSGQTVTLPEETANHLVRVMRLREETPACCSTATAMTTARH